MLRRKTPLKWNIKNNLEITFSLQIYFGIFESTNSLSLEYLCTTFAVETSIKHILLPPHVATRFGDVELKHASQTCNVSFIFNRNRKARKLTVYTKYEYLKYVRTETRTSEAP